MNIKELEALRERATHGEAFADDAIEGGGSVVMIDGLRAAFLTNRREEHKATAELFAALHNAAPYLFSAALRLDALSKAIAHVATHGNQNAAIVVGSILSTADDLERDRNDPS